MLSGMVEEVKAASLPDPFPVEVEGRAKREKSNKKPNQAFPKGRMFDSIFACKDIFIIALVFD
jgi:hypothetical protein